MNRKPNAITETYTVEPRTVDKTVQTFELGHWEAMQIGLSLTLRSERPERFQSDQASEFLREFAWLLGQPDVKITITRTFEN